MSMAEAVLTLGDTEAPGQRRSSPTETNRKPPGRKTEKGEVTPKSDWPAYVLAKGLELSTLLGQWSTTYSSLS
jgi:hypothetical protein